MDAKRPAPESDEALNGALDELYAASLEQFLQVRRALTGRLREAGNAAAARALSGANKPTRTAWAQNQVARSRPELLAALVESREAAIAAQGSANADELRASAKRYRDAVAEVVREVKSVLEEGGISLSATHARRVGETLQALTSSNEGRQMLLIGRLTRDIAVDDALVGLELSEPTGRSQAPPKRETGARKVVPTQGAAEARDSNAARAEEAERKRQEQLRAEKTHAIAAARDRVAELERTLHEAEAKAADADTLAVEAERAAARAQDNAALARRALDALKLELLRAREKLGNLRR